MTLQVPFLLKRLCQNVSLITLMICNVILCANQFSKMLIKTQDECRSVALRNFERKRASVEPSSSKTQSPPHASHGES